MLTLHFSSCLMCFSFLTFLFLSLDNTLKVVHPKSYRCKFWRKNAQSSVGTFPMHEYQFRYWNCGHLDFSFCKNTSSFRAMVGWIFFFQVFREILHVRVYTELYVTGQVILYSRILIAIVSIQWERDCTSRYSVERYRFAYKYASIFFICTNFSRLSDIKNRKLVFSNTKLY